MINNYLRYIRKDYENILITRNSFGNMFNLDYDEHNPRRWFIGGQPHTSFYNGQYYEKIDANQKKFFVFIYIGNNFPILSKYKEILPILKKYKFSKVYVAKNDYICCYYFKRGVLFYTSICREDPKDKKIISVKRLFKLLKIKNRND